MVLCTHARLGAESPLQLLANLVYDGKHSLLELLVSYVWCRDCDDALDLWV
jgi:hypothetical protein